MGRPEEYKDGDVVRITGHSKVRLQARSERRAIIDFVVDSGGRTTLKAIDDHFGYDIRPKARALIRNGWLELA